MWQWQKKKKMQLQIFNIFLFLLYIWYSYKIKLTRWKHIFGVYSVDIWHILSIYSNTRHRISNIRLWIYYFMVMNIFDIPIWSKPKFWMHSYSVQDFIFVLHQIGMDFHMTMPVWLKILIIVTIHSVYDVSTCIRKFKYEKKDPSLLYNKVIFTIHELKN